MGIVEERQAMERKDYSDVSALGSDEYIPDIKIAGLVRMSQELQVQIDDARRLHLPVEALETHLEDITRKLGRMRAHNLKIEEKHAKAVNAQKAAERR